MMGNNYDFCSSVRFSLFWNSLKYKYENNIEFAEFYLYQTLVDEVSSLALALKLDYKLCPYKVCVLPLVKAQSLQSKKIMEYLNENDIETNFDESGSIGKRYRRQDAIGTF